jgi:predicted nucleic acid-binding protein
MGFGVWDADGLAQFEAALETAEVLSFDDDAARLAGRINADLEQVGRIIGMPDVFIAAIALRSLGRDSARSALGRDRHTPVLRP